MYFVRNYVKKMVMFHTFFKDWKIKIEIKVNGIFNRQIIHIEQFFMNIRI